MTTEVIEMTVVWILLSAAALFCATRLIELEEDVTSYKSGGRDITHTTIRYRLSIMSWLRGHGWWKETSRR